VFGGLFGQVRAAGSGTVFVERLFVGLLIYQLFATATVRAPHVVLSNPNLVTKVVFPLEILPMPVIGAGLVQFAVGFALLVVGALFLGDLSPGVVLVPLLLLPILGWTLGVSWALAGLGVYLRDVQEIVRVAIHLLFFLTPIVWTFEIVPPSWQPFLWINPVTPSIEAIRAAVLGSPWPPWTVLAVHGVVAVVVAKLGLSVFLRLRKGFPDVL
jgi:lipopolysaccharide transport system permease protein